MIFKTITLKNFRQFHGKCVFNFATDEYQNITLIHGENGVGKTTLLNAVLWCFFEILTERFEKKKVLVCDETDSNTCSVEVVFLSDEKNLDYIPSPFLTGLMDPFLKEGYYPILETNRGCPFSCTFCIWGISALNKVLKFSMDRVKKEFSYMS